MAADVVAAADSAAADAVAVVVPGSSPIVQVVVFL